MIACPVGDNYSEQVDISVTTFPIYTTSNTVIL